MAAQLKDILLIGYGAVGAVYAHVLTRSGLARVTVVARSNHEIASKEGIHIYSKKYGNHVGWKPDRLVNSVASAADRGYSYVILTTKAIPDVSKTSNLLAPLLSAAYTKSHAQPTYVLLQNGLGVERELYDTASTKLGHKPNVVSTALWITTNLFNSNKIEHGAFDRMTIGIYRPDDYTTTTHTPAESFLLADLSHILGTGGTEMIVAPEIQRIKFIKNLRNICFSSITTLTGYALPALYRAPPAPGTTHYEPYLAEKTADLVREHTIPMVRAVMMEAIDVARAVGYPDASDGIPTAIVDETIANIVSLNASPDSTHRPSMLIDAERGQPIEVEVIVGEIVRMARKHNICVPRIEMLYALLLVVQNQTLRKLGK